MSLRVVSDVTFAERTTLKVGGKVLGEIHLGMAAQLDALPALLEKHGGRPFVLGQGSNVLAKDGMLPVLLVRLPQANDPVVVRQRDDKVLVWASAALPLPKLLNWCAVMGLSGLEGLAGIPGSVGGAVAMNAGSFGAQVADVLFRAQLFSPHCGLRFADKEDLQMGYRFFSPRTTDSYFIILGAELLLEQKKTKEVEQRTKAWMAKKKATQPLAAQSAGCVFKNPDNLFAGKLLEDAGFKGKGIGDMSFSEVHANFLINKGNGTATQAFELIALARQEVARKFQVNLELEVKAVLA